MATRTLKDGESTKEKPVKKEEVSEQDENEANNKVAAKQGVPQEAVKEENDTVTAATKLEKESSTGTDTTEVGDLVPIRHPQLSNQCPPIYYISERGEVYSKRGKNLRQRKPLKWTRCPTYTFGRTRIRLEELMVSTFSGPFDAASQYIIHKDGNYTNCAPDNLTVGDKEALRKSQAVKLQNLESNERYVPVKDLDDTLTFSNYMVSDTGKVYHNIQKRLLPLYTKSSGYMFVHLASDTYAGGIAITKSFLVHNVMMHSFNKIQRKGDHIVYHVNGDKKDNTLSNLKYGTLKECMERTYTSEVKAFREISRAKGECSPQHKPSPSLPPVTPDTKWKRIGVLPWNNLSFNNYEVSDAGHVRHADTLILVKVCNNNGAARVGLRADEQNNAHTGSARKYSGAYFAPVSHLVANAFVDGYTPVNSHVKHLNKDQRDNRAENLQWVKKYSQVSRRTIATLLDDPTKVKEFPSVKAAKHGLSNYLYKAYKTNYGDSFTALVMWDGEKREALIQVF